jgi:hypothetical protein
MDDDVDLTELPEQFHPLIPLIERWAISDDAQRSAAMAGASDEDKRALLAAVAPQFDAIDAYLDEHDDLEVAAYLGTLAEAAAEAAVELG